jgi:hypothetical protein
MGNPPYLRHHTRTSIKNQRRPHQGRSTNYDSHPKKRLAKKNEKNLDLPFFSLAITTEAHIITQTPYMGLCNQN